MKLGLIIILTFSFQFDLYCQCQQDHPNTLLSESKFLSLTEDIDHAENILLPFDFCLEETEDDINKYKIYHTKKVEGSSYTRMVDCFYIYKELNYFGYITTSAKNYSSYKSGLLSIGFIRDTNSTDIEYNLTKGKYNINVEFYTHITSSGQANYKILVTRTIK